MSKRSIAWSQGGENSDGSIGAQLTVEVRERLCAVPQLFADVMSTKPIAGRSRKTYEFTRAHRTEFSIQRMCRLIEVAPSGFYEWLKHPMSNRAQEGARLLRLIRASFEASQGVYGAPRVFLDLREAGETCSKHRVARLMRENKLRALHGYRTRHWSVGKLAVLVPNLLKLQFTVTRPNKARVTDITCIRAWQGWLYLTC